jgi:hypothetical protein
LLQWNNEGYDVAKIFGNKFTHISPVWLEVKQSKKDTKYELDGTHDVDKKWMVHVKNAGRERKLKSIIQLEVLDFLMGDNKSYLRKRRISVSSRPYKPTGKHRHSLLSVVSLSSICM